MSKFYITLRIHKITLHNPKWITAPVTSIYSSPLVIDSVYLDWKLQPLTKNSLPTAKTEESLNTKLHNLADPHIELNSSQ